jgi:hypothetical protein
MTLAAVLQCEKHDRLRDLIGILTKMLDLMTASYWLGL